MLRVSTDTVSSLTGDGDDAPPATETAGHRQRHVRRLALLRAQRGLVQGQTSSVLSAAASRSLRRMPTTSPTTPDQRAAHERVRVDDDPVDDRVALADGAQRRVAVAGRVERRARAIRAALREPCPLPRRLIGRSGAPPKPQVGPTTPVLQSEVEKRRPVPRFAIKTGEAARSTRRRTQVGIHLQRDVRRPATTPARSVLGRGDELLHRGRERRLRGPAARPTIEAFDRSCSSRSTTRLRARTACTSTLPRRRRCRDRPPADPRRAPRRPTGRREAALAGRQRDTMGRTPRSRRQRVLHRIGGNVCVDHRAALAAMIVGTVR